MERSHIFLFFGLLLKVSLLLLHIPESVELWFGPFLAQSVENFSFDPWQEWIGRGNSELAFPYGYVMWLSLLPFTYLFAALSLDVSQGYMLSLLVFDLMLFRLLRSLIEKDKYIIWLAWLSPITLYSIYICGYSDIIPVFFLVLAIFFAKKNNFLLAGIVICLAVSAKLSMILAVPFFIIYLFKNPPSQHGRLGFTIGLLMGFSVSIFPSLLSASGIQMIFNNPEVQKIYSLNFRLGDGPDIQIIPLAYLGLLYAAWSVRRMSFELLQTLMGLSFLMLIILTPAARGWYFWLVPFFLIFAQKSKNLTFFTLILFSFLYPFTFYAPTIFQFNFLGIQLQEGVINSLTQTTFFGAGALIFARTFKEKVLQNNYFRLIKRPFSVGIAGDSGSGKDTFVNSLVKLFGWHSVSHISGDNYHFWDRHRPMWQFMTHLNPSANDLKNFVNHLQLLINRKSVVSRHYNHTTGKKGEASLVKSKDFVFASGLHALYLSSMRECYDLSIYLDMDENLRRQFKINRDVNERGHSKKVVLEVLEKRKHDSDKFIKPQMKHADLVFSLVPLSQARSYKSKNENQQKYKLIVCSNIKMDEYAVTRVLVGVCGLHIDVESADHTQNPFGSVFIIEGDFYEDDLPIAAKMLCSHVLEFLDVQPKWENGTLGIMQLLTLIHIDQMLAKRTL